MKNGFLVSLTKVFLYISSFFPLFILLFIQNVKIRNDDGGTLDFNGFLDSFFSDGTWSPRSIFWYSVFLLMIISVISIFLFFCLYFKSDGVSGKLLGSNFERADTLGYIVTYIVPLVTMEVDSYRSLLINFGLFFTIGIFYIKNNQYFMNPIFNLLGYNVLVSDSGCVYITKLSPRKMKDFLREGVSVSLKLIAEDIYVVKGID